MEEIRVAVGRLLSVVKLIEADATGASNTFITDDLAIGGPDDYNGKWLLFTSGQTNIDGQIRQIIDVTASSNQVTLTFFPAASNAPVDGATAEMWDQEYDPAQVNGLIPQAIHDVTGRMFDHTEDITLHTGSKARVPIPTTFEMMRDVYLRTSVTSKSIIAAGIVWDELVDTDFTVTSDSEDLLFGRPATRFVIAGAVTAGDIASDSIPSLNLSNMTHIEFPIKCSIATAANDLTIRLSDTANGGATTEEIAVPALVARTETWVRVAMTAPELSTAIISVALEANAGTITSGGTVWLGEIEGTQNDSNSWRLIPRNLWSIDKQARDLVFLNKSLTGYYLMKLSGGDNPLLMTADTDTNEVPDSFMIYKTAGLLLLRDPDDLQRAQIYLGWAEREKLSLPPLVNVRLVT
jgi:hypothetical protein